MTKVWKPRPSDIAWTKALLSQIKQGGHWQVPMSGAVYMVDHINKQLVQIEGGPSDVHERTKLVLAAMGWTMADNEEQSFSA